MLTVDNNIKQNVKLHVFSELNVLW